MPYLIDGHNLIPKMSGMSLKALDDEHELINSLLVFCRAQRKSVDVYFDRATPGYSGKKKYGAVTAYFITHQSSADEAIIHRLHRMEKSAKHWIVVTSDRHIQVEARASGAKVVPSEEFAQQIQDALSRQEINDAPKPEVLSDDEVKAWLKIFSERSRKDE